MRKTVPAFKLVGRFGTLKILIAQLQPRLMNSQKQQLKREKAPRNGTASNDNSLPQIGSGRRLARGLPWVWITLSGLATLVWLAGIGWVAVKLFRWFAE